MLLNAAVVGVVMLLSACGRAEILALFGMSVGSSVAVIDYISRIFAPIESLGMEIQTIQSAMAGVKRIDAFLVQPERALPPERKNAVRGDVVFSHVTFGYDGPPVLRDFSLTVKKPASRSRWSAGPERAKARCSGCCWGCNPRRPALSLLAG